MSLIEKTLIDKIEVLQNGVIQVRKANIIEKDGKEIAKNFHRYVVNPGDNLNDQDAKVVAIANAVWTQEVINNFLNMRAETEAKFM